MDLQLHDKTALVTGSTAGIGFAIARTLAREGAHVIVNGRSQESVDEAIAELEKEVDATVEGFAGDLSDAEQARALHEAYPDVDILINNLGIFDPVPFDEIEDDEWRRFFDVNVLSGVRLSRLYLPRMLDEDWGRIVFISSESGVQIPVEMVHYGMTKAAQIAVARGIAEHVTGTGITVNSVLPGPTKSRGVKEMIESMADDQDMSFEEAEDEFIESERPSSLIERLAEVDEVANLVAYVASPLASATTGAALRVDGGVIRSAY